MFTFLRKISHITKKGKNFSVKISSLTKKVNVIDDYIIVNNEKIKVYDRICDHMGGKIISTNEEHKCPMHNWKFDPIKGTYSNGVKKKKKSIL